MFTRILVPVDLAHTDKLGRALAVAAAEARHHDAKVVYVSVTSPVPGPMGHNPKEFQEKLETFADERAKAEGIETEAMVKVAHDPSTELDETLLDAVQESGADLVIMASHKPGFAEYFFHSNGGHVAAHAATSVMLVRDD